MRVIHKPWSVTEMAILVGPRSKEVNSPGLLFQTKTCPHLLFRCQSAVVLPHPKRGDIHREGLVSSMKVSPRWE